MSYEELLRDRIIEPVETSNEDISELLKVARRDMETANKVLEFDLDWAFAIAYNSILQLTLAWMYHLGYRPRGEAKHVNTFRFLEETLPEEKQSMVSRLQRMRKKRNATIYHQKGIVSETEAHDVIDFANRYYEEIAAILPAEIVGLSGAEN